jgi:prepilin-type N-terminal cleavage/methylation domain-containing protein
MLMRHHLRDRRSRQRGFTLVELLIVVAIIVILGVAVIVSLGGKKNTNDLSSAVSQMTALLNEAQSRSASQMNNVSWGVHFANATNTAPFYALFSSFYGPTTTVVYYRLPSDVAYVSSTLPVGASLDVIFSQISGMSSVSTTIGLVNIAQSSLVSSISIASSGTIFPVLP